MVSKFQSVGLGFVATSGAANQQGSTTRNLRHSSVQTSAKRREPFPGLPFITEVSHPRPKGIVRVYFDVPAQEYGEGNKTGFAVFGACMDYLQRTGNVHPLRGVICAAAVVLEEPRADASSRRGAAVGLFTMLDEALSFSARYMDHGQAVTNRIAHMESVQRQLLDMEAREKAAFVDRMRAAKLAKRSGGATHGGAK